ncbi:Protein transport protein sft2 [Exophiala xenobiotica]|nr:Protein transport protein sft2 [Exophiala xenobiotica]KAK5547872.1 Protein transport protein sft2 [Chaetothyriales sp. CCFEE 6169]KAK5245698.1 Protein transport protein sft2 [Exophiala xenobiotica]KAK5366619.1 Protein transport protein sft2 [Exophiala xenobiotica]KAK5432120.1 Protein transport protein sft2 [Exophiala xenobiotica]
MTSTAFRDSLNSLGWSRRDPDVPANTSSTPIISRLSSLNPFGDRGYVQLPTHEAPGAPLPAPTRREEEEGWFAWPCDNAYPMMMSATSIPRMMVHAGHHTLGVRLSLVGPVGQSVSWVYASVFMEMSVWLTRRDRWSVGSMLFLASWAFLMGPYQYAIHLMSGARLPFTAAYFGSIVMTIYFAVGVRIECGLAR